VNIADWIRIAAKAANTPCRLLGLAGLYIAFAVTKGSSVYEPFLASHGDLLRPASGLMVAFWLFQEAVSYMRSEQLFPATQGQLKDVRRLANTVAGRQKRLSDTIGEAYWESDETGKLIFSNYANSRLYGTTSRDIVRTGTAPFIHKDDVQDCYRAFKQAVDGEMGFSLEFDVVDRGVSVHTLQVYAWPLFDGDGNFEGHFGSAEILGGEDGNY
jgi:PAS domain-containing protein